MRYMHLFSAIFVLAVSCTSVSADSPLDGQHDLRFGGSTSGIASAEFNLVVDAHDRAADLARLSNGKLLMLASAKVSVSGEQRYRLALARFNADGTTDNGFSGDGKHIPTTPNPEFDYVAQHLAIAPDGKYLALAWRYQNGNNAEPAVTHLCRFAVAGNLDTTFNTTGCANPVIGILEARNELATDVRFDPAGGVFVAGRVEVNPDPAFNTSAFVYKLTAQGAQDVTFGGGLGYVLLAPAGCDGCVAGAVVPLANGGAYVFGENIAANTYSWVAKIHPDGSLDTDFGVGGYALHGFGDLNNFLNPREGTADAVMDASGRIYQCGVVWNDDQPDERFIALARLTPDGDLDFSFSNDGRLLMPFNDLTAESYPRHCDLDASNRLVVAAIVGGADGVSADYGVLRFTPDGELDARFNLAGTALRGVDLGGPGQGHDELSGLALDGDGVIVAGTSHGANAITPTRRLTMVRFGTDRLMLDGFE